MIRYEHIIFLFLGILPLLLKGQTYTIDQQGIQVTCSGTIYDSGGDVGMYGLNENYEMTICASNDSCVMLVIRNLDLEYLSDFLTIHDGPTTNHPVMNNFSGTLSFDTVTSSINSGGCITIVFTSDGAGTKQGFEIGIECVDCSNSLQATEQDCLGAIPVCQTTYVQNQAYEGEGNYPNEINKAISACSFNSPGEKNDVWYAFTVQSSGNLCFTINPTNPAADYDWALFDLTNATCEDIFTDPTLEVSCNYQGTPGITGANGLPGVTNMPCVPVNVGEKYVLNVSSFLPGQGGYTLDFTQSSANIFDNIPPQPLSIDYCGGKVITLHFDEAILCSSLDAADFTFTGPGGPYIVTKASGIYCQQGAAFDNPIQIHLDKDPLVGMFVLNLVGNVTDFCSNPAALTTFNVENTMDMLFDVTDFCLGDITSFIDNSSGSIITRTWDFGDGSPTDNNSTTSHTYTSAGFYQVKFSLEDNKGCTRDSIFIVNITQKPVSAFSVTPITKETFLGNPFSFFDQSTGPVVSWLWQFGDGQNDNLQNPSYTYTAPGIYTVELYAFSGLSCYDIISTEVEVKYDIIYDVPAAFTPNGDGINDKLSFLAFGIEDFAFKIFNRWGEVVYSTNNMSDAGWDGTWRGAQQPIGVFVYYISGMNMATKIPVIKTGNVTLLR